MKDLETILNEILTLNLEVFGEGLVGVYVHGSIAFGCFNPEKSDVDYLAVIKEPMTKEEKLKYIKKLYEINRNAPEKGIEMSVVLLRYTENFTYPTPYETHFSNAYLDRINSDLSLYCDTMTGVDPDLAAHFTVTKKCGIALYGKPVDDVFAPVPREDYLAGIITDVENAAFDIINNPVYMTLNLCRVLAFIKEGIVVSKADGGVWGIENLPQKYRKPIKEAYEAYVSEEKTKTTVSAEELREFAVFMLREINGGKC